MELYEPSDANIWTTPYIREQLLKAHLDPGSDAASRKPETIAATVEWTLKNHPRPGSLIDLGCGPGLYSQAFASRGWQVLGIDINKSSIEHAARETAAKGLSARYLEQSYLTEIDAGPFDLAICIYCDFGALTRNNQTLFLQNARKLLAPGGSLVMDVFGEGISRSKTEGRSWKREEANNFWSEQPCHVLSECQHFADERVWGEKYIVIPDSGPPLTFVLWTHYFTPESIAAQLAESGFEVTESNAGIIRESDFVSTDVLFIRAKKA